MEKQLVVSKAQKAAERLAAKKVRSVSARDMFDRVALLDASGSMSEKDAAGMAGARCSRWDALGQAWVELAPKMAGRLAAYCFSGSVVPVRGSASGKVSILPYEGGNTSMCAALGAVMAHRRDGLRVLLVSDGESTDGCPVGPAIALGCPVDTVFVGGGNGAATLRQIAEATGGEFVDMGSGRFAVGAFLEAATRLLLREG
jgi:hypothetical protein